MGGGDGAAVEEEARGKPRVGHVLHAQEGALDAGLEQYAYFNLIRKCMVKLV